MSEVVERAVDPRLLAFPLGLWLGGKIERDLSNGLWKSNGQLSAGIVVTEQDIGDRGPALDSRKPRFNDSRHVLVDPVDAHRPAIYQNHHDRFAGGIDRLDQFKLMAGQIETGARSAFADRLHRIAQHDHRQV